MMSNQDSLLHKIITGFNLVCVIFGLFVCCFALSNVLGVGCEEGKCQSMLYITTTFLSTRKIETTVGWPVATERASTELVATPYNFNDPGKDRSYRFGHYLECMYSARMADTICNPSLSFNEYASCLTNKSSSALDVCASFPTVGGYSHWPTPEEYLTCLWNNPTFQNSQSQRASKNVFRACVEKSLWPFFEVPQSIDTPVFMGSYNWALFLVTGLIVMTSFGVYTASWIETGMVQQGETSYMMRLGVFWSSISLVWNIIFFAIFLAIAFRDSGEFEKGGGLPTTSSTTFVTILVYGAAVLYFLSIVFQPARNTFRAVFMMNKLTSPVAKIIPVSGKVGGSSDHESQRLLLQGTLPAMARSGETFVYSPSFELSAEDIAVYYTPPLMATWADSYFADVCIVMGVAGATGQLSTDQAWNLFSLYLIYRILNMIISRCMSEAFMNNIREEPDVNEGKHKIVSRPGMFFTHAKDNYSTERSNWKTWAERGTRRTGGGPDVHLSTKIIGLSTQLAAVYLYIGLIFLVFNQESALNDFATFQSFFIVCFVIPEALRLLVHVLYQVMYDSSSEGVPWMLYNFGFAIWIYDYVTRIIFVLVVIFETRNNPGTFDFLKTQTNALMQDYLVSMAI
jgi:hypothetical protein